MATGCAASSRAPTSPSLPALRVLWRAWAGIDADRCRQTWAQLAEPRVAVIERDADRHALNDLGEIAGGVLRRDHAENRTGPRREAQHMAAKGLSRQHVGDHRRRLARLHLRQLIFLEIGVDPQAVRRDHAEEIGAAGDIGAD